MKTKYIFSILTVLSFFNFSFAQNGNIKGIIKTSDGSPAEFVTIGLVGTNKGTSANNKGEYEIKNIEPGIYKLKTSFVGLETKEQQIEVKANETTIVPEISLKENAQTLKEIVVSASNPKKYIATDNTSATRMELKLMEIPGSVQTINNVVLRDQQVNNVQEAVKNIPGVNTFSSYDDYSFRGFRSYSGGYDGNIAVNGQPGSLGTFDVANATFNIDKIESIKGPASVLFSRATPGGVLNYVTKQPLENRRIETDFTYGSFDQYRGMFDMTGSLTKNKKLLGRFIVGYENTKSFRDYEHNKTLFIAPSLLYKFSDKTSWKIEANYFQLDAVTSFERGIFATKNTDGTWNYDAVPISWSRHTKKGVNKMRNFSVQSQFKHSFNENISLHIQNYYNNVTNETPFAIGGGYVTMLPSDTAMGDMSGGPGLQTPGKLPNLTNNVFLNFNFKTGKIKHRAIVGVDYMTYGRYYEFFYYPLPNAPIANPDLGDSLNTDISNLSGAYIGYDANTIFGAYIQDQIIFSPKLKALIGGRFDQSKYIGTYYGYPNKDSLIGSDTSDARAFVPRAGIVYQPNEQLSFYYNYSESFQPQYSNNRLAGGPFLPERGKQHELGAKKTILNEKLAFTLALYHITKVNVLTPDPTDSLGIRQTQRGEVQSKGVEFIVQGEIIKGLNGIVGYSYNEAKVTKSEAGDVGQWNQMAPNTTWSVWLKYTLQKGALKNLGVAFGSNYVGQRTTYTGPDFVLPAYTVFEAGISYKYKKASIGLNVYNLADKLYFTGGYNSSIIWPGAPRSFRLNLNYTF